ncbi:DNA polymerase IV [Rhabdothermincola salaria]|uniref:DNA polymerase IV n=1 Tax=Rhabdothermincola salaria TaxID=2903142 RepID=UPI001E5B3330|nr:DNA polymerase IV [Rhabdothermincola salaria]MCD9624870.1 DNA polymerase IV [Rhabdothermincola salaria]
MAGDAATILHADLDAFYASVEQLLDPDLRGRPVAVGGGVVLAASYEAKAHGVTGGMAGWRARQLCPDLVVVGGHFAEYQRLGDAVIDVCRDITPLVERISIDEAFLDVAGAVHLFGDPAAIATDLRRRVRDELGLPISVGVATTKHLAKVASQVAKPDGLVVVAPGEERSFLAPLPVELLWGVGPVTRERLAARGIRTIGQLADAAPDTVRRHLGEAVGSKLADLAANRDPRPVEGGRRARSVGAQSALGRRRATDETLSEVLGFLADRVGGRLRRKGLAGRTITVRVRFTDMSSVTRSTTLPSGVAGTRTLTEAALALARAAVSGQPVRPEDRQPRPADPDDPGRPEITLLGLSVANLGPDLPVQLELPLDSGRGEARSVGAAAGPRSAGSHGAAGRAAVERAVDELRDRFGRDVVGYARVALRADRGVPDAFRELAESDGDAPAPARDGRPARRGPP